MDTMIHRPLEELEAQTAAKPRFSGFQFLGSLHRFGGGWFANRSVNQLNTFSESIGPPPW